MSLVLTEEQAAIQKTARDFVREQLPISQLRRLRDERDATGFSRAAWSRLAELGLVGVTIAEDYGGAGLGYAELGLILEECGRTLASTPFLASVVLAGEAIAAAGSTSQKRELLSGIAAGERTFAFAHEEGRHHAPYQVALRATATAGGFSLSGEKVFVLDGHVADTLIVVARTAGAAGDRAGLTLLVVPATDSGVTVTRTSMVDTRNAAALRFANVAVDESMVIGGVGHGADVLDRVLDRATIALSAEMLGGVLELFERTVAYLKERVQFGVPIGSFQALQHRAAMMFCEIELSKSIVLHALRAVDEGQDDLALVASCAKARLSDTYELLAAEAVQMHGGIGVTDELDIGLFVKRAKVAAMTFGTASYHRDRFARVQGY